MERFDVVVVGGRVSGAAIATRFARAGLSVLILERAGPESDVLSTHTIQDVDGLAEIVSDSALLSTGAPRLTSSTLWVDDLDMSTRHAEHPWISIRRTVLDELLRRSAEESGAQVRFEHRVTALHVENGRVAGVRYRNSDNGREHLVRAGLVIGADGRSSTVARLVGARRYNVSWNERGAAWCYLRGVTASPTFYSQRFDDHLLLAAPCEYGLVMLAAQPTLAVTKRYRPAGAVEDLFRQYGRSWEADGPNWTERLAGAERVDNTRIMLRYQCFFREAAGAGWALLGDAGHTKDVVTGQGISDALRQAERLVPLVLAGWPDPRAVDAATQRFWRRRDRSASPMYWLSQDMGRAGAVGPLYRGFFEKIADSPKLRTELQNVLGQRRPVRRFTSVTRIASATARHARRSGVDRSALLADVLSTSRTELRRRRLEIWPDVQPERRESAGSSAIDGDGNSLTGIHRPVSAEPVRAEGDH